MVYGAFYFMKSESNNDGVFMEKLLWMIECVKRDLWSLMVEISCTDLKL